MDSKVLTILFTDMKGFTETSGSRSREGILDLVRRHDDLLRPAVFQLGGRVVKTIGDAFLATFESPTNAVLCGLLMQATLREHNRTAPSDQRIEVRIAINAGEVQLTDDDVFGEPVNIAARINGITEPGEVYFTHAVYLAMNRSEVPSSEVGERILKGVPEPIKVYRLMQDDTSDRYRRIVAEMKDRAAASDRSGRRRRMRVVTASAAILAVAIAVLGWWSARPDAVRRALDFARAGGFAQAWQELDQRFREAPADPRLRDAAREVLEAQLALDHTSGNPERSIEFLEAQRKERGYIPDLDARIVAAKKAGAAQWMKSPEDIETYAKGLALLWSRVEADPQDGPALLDWVAAYTGFPQRWESKVVEHLDHALRLAPSLTTDPRAREIVLTLVRGRSVPASHEEDVARLWDLAAAHWGSEVEQELLPKIVDEAEVEGRLYAYGILSRRRALSPADVFEYHRLNLFQCFDFLSSYHRAAVEYFTRNFRDRPEAARPFTQGQAYLAVPLLEKYLDSGLEEAIPVISSLFFEGCLQTLLDGVLRREQVVLRYNCQRLLTLHGEMTQEMWHEYHLLNLQEHGPDQLRWSYPWIEEALKYLQSPIDDKARRAEAAQLVLAKLEMVRRVRQDDQVEKREETLAWLEGELEKARQALGAQGE